MIGTLIRSFVVLGVLLLAGPTAVAETRTPEPANANRSAEVGRNTAERSPPVPVVLAGGWSIGKLITGGGRTRIVQFCAVIMCIGLFIMMRK